MVYVSLYVRYYFYFIYEEGIKCLKIQDYYRLSFRYFRIFTIVTQIILGAWVRLTGSGMSCPDWPLCYGFFSLAMKKINNFQIIEYSYFQIFLEWIHRANAAFIIGPLTIILFLYIILNKKVNKNKKTYSIYLIILLGIQGLLGGLTVMKSNIPWSVAIAFS